MEIIAKTDNGFLIQANASEIIEILMAVNGKSPEKIEIGQKIPAIDYAGTIKKLKSLPEDYKYKQLIEYASEFNKRIKEIDAIVKSASDI